MFPAVMSNSTSLSEEASTVSSGTRVQDFCNLNPMVTTISTQQQQKIKKKRNLPGNPDPDAEVIALSPKTLLATNRFVCEICNKGFQRDQNLQLHRRGHNLPWKLKQRNSKENRKRAYVCPEPTCIHHHPSRALGDLTGIKKHFCRKHGEKKWKCDKCSKIYAVQSDWKAHSKTCGTREYRCDCGTLFSRKDSFITHRAFCDALAEESARLVSANPTPQPFNLQLQNPSSVPAALFPFSTQQHVNHHHHHHQHQQHFPNPQMHISLTPWDPPQNPNPNPNPNPLHIKPEFIHFSIPPPVPISSPFLQQPATKALQMITSPFQNLNASTQPTSNAAHLSATALLQKAATVGHVASTMTRLGSAGNYMGTGIAQPEYLGFTSGDLATWQKSDRLTRDFLGLTADQSGGNGNIDVNANVNLNVRNVLSFTGGVEFPAAYDPDPDHSLLKPQGFGFAEAAASETWGNC